MDEGPIVVWISSKIKNGQPLPCDVTEKFARFGVPIKELYGINTTFSKPINPVELIFLSLEKYRKILTKKAINPSWINAPVCLSKNVHNH